MDKFAYKNFRELNYKVYIRAFNNFPIADWAVSAYQGFKENQANIVFFEDIEEVPTSKYNIVVTFIEETNKYLQRFGIDPKQAINIPKELRDYKWLKRDVQWTTMGFLKAHPDVFKFPLFVKPDGRAKEFVAGVVSKPELLPIYFNAINDETRVLTSSIIDIVSEYRTYIIDGQIRGCKWYLGDHLVFPDAAFIKEAVDTYKSAPAGYSMDFAVLKDGSTVLVECNDGWSLGNYGLDHTVYSKLLATRWREMFKNI